MTLGSRGRMRAPGSRGRHRRHSFRRAHGSVFIVVESSCISCLVVYVRSSGTPLLPRMESGEGNEGRLHTRDLDTRVMLTWLCAKA